VLQDRTHTPLPVSPANLAELQTMLDGADEGTTLDLQVRAMHVTRFAGACHARTAHLPERHMDGP